MKHSDHRKRKKNKPSERFLDVSFGVSRAGHPEIYNFFLEEAQPILAHLKQPRITLVLERLEPLNRAYSHLDVSNKIMEQIFRRFCRSHYLKPFASFSKKQPFSCRGKIPVRNLTELLEDYNLLFDIFFADIQIRAGPLFIDAMDLFSNRVLVRSDANTMKKFQLQLKKSLPKTRFRMV